MSKERDFDQWIDDYIFGRLDEKSSQQFRERLEDDQALAAQFRLRKEMKEGIEAFGRKDLKATLINIHSEITEKPKISVQNNRLGRYAIIATLLLALLAALFWWWMNNTKQIEKEKPEQLYLAYFEPYPLSDSQRSESNEGRRRLEQLYKEKKYTEVLPLLQAHLDTLNIKPSNILLATGISALESNDTEKALQYFKQITENGDFNFKDEVSWYTALAYLKSGNVSNAREALMPLLEDKQADHHEDAIELESKF